MLTFTTHPFGPCSGWSWLRISAIAKGFMGISRVSSSGVETVVVSKFVFFNNTYGSVPLRRTRQHSRVVDHGACHPRVSRFVSRHYKVGKECLLILMTVSSLDTSEIRTALSGYKHDFAISEDTKKQRFSIFFSSKATQETVTDLVAFVGDGPKRPKCHCVSRRMSGSIAPDFYWSLFSTSFCLDPLVSVVEWPRAVLEVRVRLCQT